MICKPGKDYTIKHRIRGNICTVDSKPWKVNFLIDLFLTCLLTEFLTYHFADHSHLQVSNRLNQKLG